MSDNRRLGGVCIEGRLPKFDGFKREPFWVKPDRDSTFYNAEMDRQGSVPTRSVEELRKEVKEKLEMEL